MTFRCNQKQTNTGGLNKPPEPPAPNNTHNPQHYSIISSNNNHPSSKNHQPYTMSYGQSIKRGLQGSYVSQICAALNWSSECKNKALQKRLKPPLARPAKLQTHQSQHAYFSIRHSGPTKPNCLFFFLSQPSCIIHRQTSGPIRKPC